MPITPSEKDKLNEILSKINSGPELMRLTGALYNTLIRANIKTEPLMSLGKFIFARVEWKDIPAMWQLNGGKTERLNENIRLPLLRACEDFFRSELVNVVDLIPEPVNVAEEIADAEAAALAGSPVPEEFSNPPEEELDPAPAGTRVEAKPSRQQKLKIGEVLDQPAAVTKPAEPPATIEKPVETPVETSVETPVQAASEPPKSNGVTQSVPIEDTTEATAPTTGSNQ